MLHDSLLPSYRGFSPTVWAMVNGETRTGATLFEAVPAVDAGAIVGQEEVAIDPDETIADVMAKVTDAYLALVERFLPALVDGSAPRRPQDESRRPTPASGRRPTTTSTGARRRTGCGT